MEKINSNKIVKLGIVVDNIEAVAKRYNELFHLKEKAVVRYPDPNKAKNPKAYKKYLGQKVDAKLKSCIVNLHPIYLEIVEPFDETPSPWLDYLKRHGSGVCFLSFYVDGFKEQIDFMEKGGYPLSFVEEKGFERYAYFNTQDKIGMTIELKEQKPLEE